MQRSTRDEDQQQKKKCSSAMFMVSPASLQHFSTSQQCDTDTIFGDIITAARDAIMDTRKAPPRPVIHCTPQRNLSSLYVRPVLLRSGCSRCIIM